MQASKSFNSGLSKRIDDSPSQGQCYCSTSYVYHKILLAADEYPQNRMVVNVPSRSLPNSFSLKVLVFLCTLFLLLRRLSRFFLLFYQINHKDFLHSESKYKKIFLWKITFLCEFNNIQLWRMQMSENIMAHRRPK